MAEYTLNPVLSKLSSDEWLRIMRERYPSRPDNRDTAKDDFGYMPQWVDSRTVPNTETNQTVEVQEGGFFQPIDSGNMHAAIRAIFSDEPGQGQWLIDLSEKHPEMRDKVYDFNQIGPVFAETVKEMHLNAEQHAFALSWFAFEIISNDPSSRREFNAKNTNNYRTDGTITAAEMYDFVEHRIPNFNKKDLGNYQIAFVQFAGGLMQARADMEFIGYRGIPHRHDVAELDTIPPMYRAAVNNVLAFQPPDERNFQSHWR